MVFVAEAQIEVLEHILQHFRVVLQQRRAAAENRSAEGFCQLAGRLELGSSVAEAARQTRHGETVVLEQALRCVNLLVRGPTRVEEFGPQIERAEAQRVHLAQKRVEAHLERCGGFEESPGLVDPFAPALAETVFRCPRDEVRAHKG